MADDTENTDFDSFVRGSAQRSTIRDSVIKTIQYLSQT
jgi:hypothetical protein